jgi:hypothetical protein
MGRSENSGAFIGAQPEERHMTQITLHAPATGGSSVNIVAGVLTAAIIGLTGFLSIAQFVSF